MAGILYAPTEGVETRRKLNKLKGKLGLGDVDHENMDRETLHELKGTLQKQLRKIEAALEEKA